MGSWGSVLPSQPGPPVTSGCWSQFSTLPQAQSICWGFRHGGDFVKGKEGGVKKKGMEEEGIRSGHKVGGRVSKKGGGREETK